MAGTDYLRFALAFILVIGLIGLFAWLARRFRLPSRLAGHAGGAGRIEIVESRMITARQRLLLIRRDDQEHLLLLGQDQGLVIERGIAARATPSAAVPPAGGCGATS
jgi:flagellar protein FliO/FliZ